MERDIHEDSHRTCQECGITFPFPSLLQAHIVEEHCKQYVEPQMQEESLELDENHENNDERTI